MSESNSINPQQSPELSLNSLNLSIETSETPLTSEEGEMKQFFALLEDIEPETSDENPDIPAEKVESADIIAETEAETEKEAETNWFDLACRLKKQNQELIQTVVSLEQALAQAKHDIQEQQRLSRKKEEIIPENTIEKAIEIESLTVENKELQQQMAQLEREYAILKEECQEKNDQLTTAERHIRELHSRLQRQQRYTLQYKAALEQHLGETLDDPIEMTPDSPSSKVPIQPWSDQTIASTDTNSATADTASTELPTRSPSFQVNLSKVANQYDSQKPNKSRHNEEMIDLPHFLRRRPS